ncbi:uncharacterized domain 1 [hydrothermal vent metagenome]|uniref:Uncharacterized domain 1 n=1 Tax=hydrothermal vent metagenome TaxID=652676 RepID=A0A3B0T2U6_9ZZZZ
MPGPEFDSDRIFGIVPADVALALSGLEFLSRIASGDLPAPPFARTAKMALTEVTGGRAVFEAHPAEAFFNPMGTIHGGWIATVLDSSLGCAVHSTLEPGYLYTTVELSIRLVRKVTLSSGPMICEGKIVHQGRRMATAEARLFDRDGKLAAHGSTTCLIVKVPGPA